MRPERAFDTGSWMTSNKLQWYQVISAAISGYFINMTESRWEKTHTTAAFLNIKQKLNTSFPQKKPDLKYKQYIWIENASTKIMHLLCIEYVPQLRPSPQLIRQKTMIQMVWDDLLAYGEQITPNYYYTSRWETLEKSEFLNRLDPYCV